MPITQNSIIFSNKISLHHLPPIRYARKFRPTLVKKQDITEKSTTPQNPILPLKVSNVFLARSAVAVLGLGFIDAGYSGDWSRIGVISNETEELLKIAALVVVPLCLFLIVSFSKEEGP